MQSTAQCDRALGWDFCNAHVMQGQRSQWEAIKTLVLHLRASRKTSPCAGKKRQRWFCTQGPHIQRHGSSI